MTESDFKLIRSNIYWSFGFLMNIRLMLNKGSDYFVMVML